MSKTSVSSPYNFHFLLVSFQMAKFPYNEAISLQVKGLLFTVALKDERATVDLPKADDSNKILNFVTSLLQKFYMSTISLFGLYALGNWPSSSVLLFTTFKL